MGVDLHEVWNVIENDLPQLEETVEAMREEIGGDSPQGVDALIPVVLLTY